MTVKAAAYSEAAKAKNGELPVNEALELLEKLFEKGVFSEAVKAGSFSVDNYNIIHLDLDESFKKQMNSMGTSGEYIMLGSLANTFLDAFDADGLSLSVNGEILETGHTIYDFTIEFQH